MEDEDLIDFDEARPAGLHSLRLPAFWVDVDEPAQVAAVSSRGSGRGRSGGNRGGRAAPTGGGSGKQPGGQQAASQFKAAASLLPREMARIQSGLCPKHFNYGDKAHSCTPLCSWGN